MGGTRKIPGTRFVPRRAKTLVVMSEMLGLVHQGAVQCFGTPEFWRPRVQNGHHHYTTNTGVGAG